MKKYLILISSFLFFQVMTAQTFSLQVVASGGGVIESNDIAFHFTIGETIIETLENSDAVFTQGFQQPLDITVQVFEVAGTYVDITMFPNPTSDLLNIRFSPPVSEPLTFKIMDLLGRTLLFEASAGVIQDKQIDLSDFPGNLFVVSVFQEENEVFRSFVIKK